MRCSVSSPPRRSARPPRSDFQQACVVRVADPKRREAIGALFPAMPWIAEAPMFFIFLGDADVSNASGKSVAWAIANDTLEGFFNATVDGALVMQAFILAAESVGLGCRPISVITNRIDQVASICALPDKVLPVAGLCVGYPVDGQHISMRVPRTVTVDCDAYRDDLLQRRIDEYDHAHDARRAFARDQQRAPDRFGYADFYGRSEDKARQAASPEGAAIPGLSQGAWVHARLIATSPAVITTEHVHEIPSCTESLASIVFWESAEARHADHRHGRPGGHRRIRQRGVGGDAGRDQEARLHDRRHGGRFPAL
jgi:hypothetical protein